MVQSPLKPLTLDAFLALPDTEPASEYIDGHVFAKPMPQGQHSTLQVELTETINAVVKRPKIAKAYTELRCIFGGRAIVPDIAVFAWERIPVNVQGMVENIFNREPDWLIEILSPDQSPIHVIDKLLHSLNHGSKMGWLVDPATRSVLVYPTQQQPQLFKGADDILPVPDFAQGLDLTAAEVFAWLKHQ
ncbi:MAG: Uma2 family endonuclease [Spirulinaceae cyanobacterium]